MHDTVWFCLYPENKGEQDLIGGGCLSESKEDFLHSRFVHRG